MFGNLTRIGSNFHAQESYYNLKKINGNILSASVLSYHSVISVVGIHVDIQVTATPQLILVVNVPQCKS